MSGRRFASRVALATGSTQGVGETLLDRAEAEQPFGRLIKTDELVATLAFVLSDEAGMMTGAIIDYDQSVQGAGDRPVPPPKVQG